MTRSEICQEANRNAKLRALEHALGRLTRLRIQSSKAAAERKAQEDYQRMKLEMFKLANAR